MTHRELINELSTIIPLEVELLQDDDYKIDLEDYELYSNNYTIQIKEGFVSKELIYFSKGDYFEPEEYEFLDLEPVINHVKIYNKEDNEIELTDNQHLILCNYIRVHKITE
jgi:hypothetical protein